MATQAHAVVATASAVRVGVDAAASTSGGRVVVGSGRKGAQSLVSSRRRFVKNGSLEEQRPRAIAVRTGKEKGIYAKGTQFFKLGGRKEEEDEKEEAVSSGTQFFGGLGGWRRKKADGGEDEEVSEKPARFGTQRLRFGTKRGGVDSGNGAATVKGGALVRKESTPLDALAFGRGRRNDPRTVFVAGATGQIGARISQQLLHAGFNIRGGVRDIYFAQQLAECATQFARGIARAHLTSPLLPGSSRCLALGYGMRGAVEVYRRDVSKLEGVGPGGACCLCLPVSVLVAES